MVFAAEARVEIADFLSALITVYTLIILAYIVINLIFAFGARPGYYRWLDAVLTFMHDVVEPYLRVFRRFLPPLGPLDLSPVVAVFVLELVRRTLLSTLDALH